MHAWRGSSGAAAKIAGCYALLGLAWIYFSDAAAASMISNPKALTEVQTYKGMAYVLITTLAMYALIRHYMSHLDAVNQGLIKAEREIVARLSLAAEYRDDETGNHVRRVAKYCSALGRQVGFSEAECEVLEHATALHDVGKIGIPDSVLLKEGLFDESDTTIMRAHTVIGAGLLAGGTSEIIKCAERIAISHHEHWDGNGYPAGMKGDKIPLEGRICAIADVFDALTSRRRYKSEWPFENAIAELQNQSGSQFDPYLVAAFLDILPEIRAIRDAYPDSTSSDGDRYQVAA